MRIFTINWLQGDESVSVILNCLCGISYHLKDQYAGRLLECPQCGAHIRAPHREVSPFFDRDKFLLREKHFSINTKYYVRDEAGKELLFVERPSHFFLRMVILFGPLLIFGSKALVPMIAISYFFGPKRDIGVYSDDSKKTKLLEIFQDNWVQFPRASYTVRDPAGLVLGTFKKNRWTDILRKRWLFYSPEGTLVLTAREDSIILSLMRRLTGIFIDFAVFRTNFVIYEGESEQVIGEFNRRFTIFDRYTLDMSEDPDRVIDRRVALSLGVLLDTGEGR